MLSPFHLASAFCCFDCGCRRAIVHISEMKILNQSITPHGQSALPSKVANFQDISQHLPVTHLDHGSQSIQLCKSTKLKKKILITANSCTVPREPCHMNTDLDAKIQRQGSMLDSIDKNDASELSQLLENEGLCHFLTQPSNQIEHGKKDMAVISSSAEFKPFTLSFVRSLMENVQINLLKYTEAELDLTCNKLANTLVVAVSSAVKLDHKQMDRIARKMQRITDSTNVRLENTIDPSLIAGFVITYEKQGFHVIDLSVKGQLDGLVARIESTDERLASHSHSWGVLNKES